MQPGPRRRLGRIALLATLLLSAPLVSKAEVSAEPGASATPPGDLGLDAARARVYDLVMERTGAIEGALRSAFGRLLGDPDELQLQVDAGRRSELLGGRFRRVAIHFTGGALDLLEVEEATLEAFDVLYDLPALLAGTRDLPESVGETRLDVRVGEAALNRVVEAKGNQLRVHSPRFALEDGRLEFRGRIRFLFMRNEVRLAGALEAREGAEIHFRPSAIEVSRIPVPGFLVRSLAGRFNPVLDLRRAAFWETFNTRLGSVDVEGKSLRIRSHATPAGPIAGEPAWYTSAPSREASPGAL